MNKLSDEEIKPIIYNFIALTFEESDEELYNHPDPKNTLDWEFDGWQEKVKILKEQISSKNYSDNIIEEANSVLEVVDRVNDIEIEEFNAICKKLAEGHINNLLTIIDKIDKDIYTTTLSPYSTDFITTTLNSHHSATIQTAATPTPAPQTTKKTITLKEIIEKYLIHTSDENTWTKDNLRDNQNSMNLLLLHYGNNTNIRSIDRNSLLDFRSLLLKLPIKYTEKTAYRELTTLTEIIDKSNQINDKAISKNMVGKHLGRLSSFFIECLVNKNISENPFIKLSVSGDDNKNSRRGYNDTELELLFKTPLYTQDIAKILKSNPQQVFIPLIAMFTGLRMNEICQLYKSDIQVVDGVWSIDINRNLDKSVKNDDSIRTIPIHTKLIEAGFLRYVDSVETPRLWNNLKKYTKYENDDDGEGLYSKDFSKWYRTQINRKHITQDKQVVFHSYRHNTAIKLIKSKVQGEHIAGILGHTQDLGMTYSRYGEKMSPELLEEEIEKISYSNVAGLDTVIEKISDLIK